MSYVESPNFYRPQAPYFGPGGSSRLVPGWGSSRMAAGPSVIAIGDAATPAAWERFSVPLLNAGVPASIAVPVAQRALSMLQAGAQEAAVLGVLAQVPSWVLTSGNPLEWVLIVMDEQIPLPAGGALPPTGGSLPPKLAVGPKKNVMLGLKPAFAAQSMQQLVQQSAVATTGSGFSMPAWAPWVLVGAAVVGVAYAVNR